MIYFMESRKMKIKLKSLNKENVKIAARIQYEIFPHSASYVKYLEENYKERLSIETIKKIKEKSKSIAKRMKEFKEDKGIDELKNIRDEIDRRIKFSKKR